MSISCQESGALLLRALCPSCVPSGPVLCRWAKLCMLIVGGMGLFATRTLYDENTLIAIRGEDPGTSCGLPSVPGDPTFDIEGDVEPALSSVVDAMSPPLFTSACDGGPDGAPPTPARKNGAPTLPGTCTGQGSDMTPLPRHRMHRRCWCFDPPTFSCSRCSRALAATFSGLTLWVSQACMTDAQGSAWWVKFVVHGTM